MSALIVEDRTDSSVSYSLVDTESDLVQRFATPRAFQSWVERGLDRGTLTDEGARVLRAERGPLLGDIWDWRSIADGTSHIFIDLNLANDADMPLLQPERYQRAGWSAEE